MIKAVRNFRKLSEKFSWFSQSTTNESSSVSSVSPQFEEKDFHRLFSHSFHLFKIKIRKTFPQTVALTPFTSHAKTTKKHVECVSADEVGLIINPVQNCSSFTVNHFQITVFFIIIAQRYNFWISLSVQRTSVLYSMSVFCDLPSVFMSLILSQGLQLHQGPTVKFMMANPATD